MNSVIKTFEIPSAIEWFLKEHIFPGKKGSRESIARNMQPKFQDRGAFFSPTGVLFPWVISTGEVLFY